MKWLKTEVTHKIEKKSLHETFIRVTQEKLKIALKLLC